MAKYRCWAGVGVWAGWTSQFQLLLFVNSNVFRCAAEQIQSTGVAFVRLFQKISLRG
jgi:hypothetical protein